MSLGLEGLALRVLNEQQFFLIKLLNEVDGYAQFRKLTSSLWTHLNLKRWRVLTTVAGKLALSGQSRP